MAKQDRNDATTRMLASFREGNFRDARALALETVREGGPSADEAQRLLERTEVDRRAFAVGFAALGLGIFYLVVFILLR